jgi:hypothetical protein
MSFMKPLLGPIAGGLTSMIPGGAAFAPLVSSAVGGAMASSPNSSALGPVGQGMQAGYNLSGTMAGLAGKSFNPVIDYWSRILSGNRGAAMSALAPEITKMGDQNTAEMRAASELMPRTGGRASLLQMQPFQNMRGVQSLFQSLRPQAATTMGNLGNNLMSNSLNALNAGTSAGRSIMDYQLQKQLQDRMLGQTMGPSLMDAFKNVNLGGLGGLFNRGAKVNNLPGSISTDIPTTPPFMGGGGGYASA